MARFLPGTGVDFTLINHMGHSAAHPTPYAPYTLHPPTPYILPKPEICNSNPESQHPKPET